MPSLTISFAPTPVSSHALSLVPYYQFESLLCLQVDPGPGAAAEAGSSHDAVQALQVFCRWRHAREDYRQAAFPKLSYILLLFASIQTSTVNSAAFKKIVILATALLHLNRLYRDKKSQCVRWL